MTNPEKDILLSMTLLRNNIPGKSEECKQAMGKYDTKLKVWQIKAINYTIVIGLLTLISLIIYSVI